MEEEPKPKATSVFVSGKTALESIAMKEAEEEEAVDDQYSNMVAPSSSLYDEDASGGSGGSSVWSWGMPVSMKAVTGW